MNVEVTEVSTTVEVSDTNTIVQVVEENVGVVHINLGPKGDPGEDGDILSDPPIGGFVVKNFYLNSSKHLVVVYDDRPIT
jgi:hypothetical protein